MQSAIFSTRICFNGEIILTPTSVIFWQSATWTCLMYEQHLFISLKLKSVFWLFPVEILKMQVTHLTYIKSMIQNPTEISWKIYFKLSEWIVKIRNPNNFFIIILNSNADLQKFTFCKGFKSCVRKFWRVKKENRPYLLAFFNQSICRKKVK